MSREALDLNPGVALAAAVVARARGAGQRTGPKALVHGSEGGAEAEEPAVVVLLTFVYNGTKFVPHRRRDDGQLYQVDATEARNICNADNLHMERSVVHIERTVGDRRHTAPPDW